MKKIRINELARELEVKPGAILDLLPGFGVVEKKTHSSSIDEDVALAVRHKLVDEGSPNGDSSSAPAEAAEHAETSLTREKMTETSVAVEEPPVPVERHEEERHFVPPASFEAPRPAPSTAAPEESGGPPPAPLEPEKPRSFLPLRPPIHSGGAIHPPLASPSSAGQANRTISVPARPIVSPVRRGLAPTGPRQPMPSEFQKPSGDTFVRPARPVSASAPPPTHVVAPGAPPPVGDVLPPNLQFQTASVPGTPLPRPSVPRPPGPTPGAPIAPRPQGTRLAGQPAARPVVPPRPDVLARLQQARPGLASPGSPRPGAPARPQTPTPGQPIFRGPIRPGQPAMRGPGMPPPLGQPARRPAQRPMHPTTPLRPETAAPPPAEQQRRHQAKPGGRRPREEDQEEGVLRQRASKRNQIAEPPPIDREITVAEGITVKELSEKLGVKANLVIKKLVEKKIFATINQTLDVKLAEEISREFGASTNKVSYEEESSQEIEQADEAAVLVRRAPIVTVMGHVDHGKTSLLDALRETRVADREAGGITQHIGAYYIEKNGRKIVFIDTPGHQAFTRMRARGAKVTDIVVLVVAADDGVMPQTLEAIDHAKAAGVPIIVAINKIDKPGAQIDRIKQQLSDRSLLAEDWGGDVVMVPVSAKAHQNLDLLLEMILLVADIQDLKANPLRPAIGTVLEAKLDKGRGPVATVLVRNGTLHTGDFFICGSTFSKVRAMFDDRTSQVKDAEPSMPVEVIGFEDLPEVGDIFQVVTDTAKAKQIVTYRESKAREAAMAKGARVATLDSLNRQFKEGDFKDLNLIIKADVGGTAEVLSDSLQQLSNDKIRVRVLHAGVGAITESDVLLASASQAIIIGFNVKPERNAAAMAEQQKIEIRQHNIIYELIDEVKLAMTGLLDPVYKEVVQGHVEVKEVFKISKVGVVAGCYVSDGFVRRDSELRVKRDGAVVHTGRVDALKRFKNDAGEVKAGTECGISIVNYNGVQAGDILEAFVMERVLPSLQTA